jgi:hypothetical protein
VKEVCKLCILTFKLDSNLLANYLESGCPALLLFKREAPLSGLNEYSNHPTKRSTPLVMALCLSKTLAVASHMLRAMHSASYHSAITDVYSKCQLRGWLPIATPLP